MLPQPKPDGQGVGDGGGQSAFIPSQVAIAIWPSRHWLEQTVPAGASGKQAPWPSQAIPVQLAAPRHEPAGSVLAAANTHWRPLSSMIWHGGQAARLLHRGAIADGRQ